MKDKSYGAAIWSSSWDHIYRSTNECEQGSVGLVDGQVLLEVPFGELLGQRGVYNLDAGSVLPSEKDYLYGFTQRGYYVALREAWYAGGNESTPGGISQRIRARYLLASRDQFNPRSRISKIEMTIDGLNEWASLFSAFAIRDSSTHLLTAVKIDLSEKDNRILLDNDEMRATLFHKLKNTPLTINGICITHDCGLLVKMASPCSFDKAVSIARTICSFFSFCNDGFAELLSLSFSFEDSDAAVDCLGSFERAPLTTHVLNPDDIVFPLSLFGPSLGTVFERWMNAEGRLAIARDIVTTLNNGTWTMSIDLAFTTIAQVLESLTKHDVDIRSLPEEKYQMFRKTVLESIDDPEMKAWAANKLNGNSKGQTRLLKEFLVANDDVAGWVFGDHRDSFVELHVATRNYLVHRGESTTVLRDVLRGEELSWHTWACILLTKLFVAKLMGFDTDALVTTVKESTRWVRIRNKALSVYASHSQ